ncbi:hypothetical protein HDF10_001326 [Edaphobacter lichenicola]|uniref:Uncharacterized protein n=1 Tax=Tunturiibacter lichenicola TaxID=2051959 RepID=A0A7W8N499_9BACT|nr:hypothetical protein [Edaphobacter lichenicola]
MSQRAHIPTILAHTSQPRIEASLLLALAALDEEPHTSPTAVSPFSRFFARQDAGGTTVPPDTVHPLTALVAGLGGRRTQRVFCCLVAMASDAPCNLQTSVSVEHHLSRIFPAHPRSLASVLTPRPAALRCSASATPPYGSGFPNKNIPRKMRAAAAQSAGEIFLRSLRRKHISALGAGHLASLRAGVSRAQSGQIQTGEMTWHSTKTTSS